MPIEILSSNEVRSIIKMHDDAINDVAEKMMEKFDIREDTAKAILKIGVTNAIILNRFRKAFDNEEL